MKKQRHLCKTSVIGIVVLLVVIILFKFNGRSIKFGITVSTLEMSSDLDSYALDPVEPEMPLTTKLTWQPKGLRCKLIYVKIPKCASSTLSGIARRIASHSQEFNYTGIYTRRTGLPGRDTDTCAVYASHYPRPRFLKTVRQPEYRDSRLLYTFVRHPASRILSQYFHFSVSRRHTSGAEEDVLKFLKWGYKRDFLVGWIADWIKNCNKVKSEEKGEVCLDKIFSRFDFMGVVERMEESLVVFKILNGLAMSDILFLGSSKTNGGFDDQGVRIQPTLKTERIMDYLEHKFDGRYAIDLELYKKVEETLDNTIESLGRDLVNKEVREYKELLKEASSYCRDRVFFPYDAEGRPQKTLSKEDCYWNDNGCGIVCLEEFLSRKKLGVTL